MHLCTIFIKQFRHENHSVDAAFLTDLFIPTNKYPKFCATWALCRQSSILSPQDTRVPEALSTQDTRVPEALWYTRNSGTQDTRALEAIRHSRHLNHQALKILYLADPSALHTV